MLSTVTPTGAQVARERLAGRAVHRYFPLDLPGPVGRALGRRAAPLLHRDGDGALAELHPRPRRARRAVHDRQRPHLRSLVPALPAGAAPPGRRARGASPSFAMQSDEDARRIVALGAPPERVVVTGNLKADAVAEPGGRRLGAAPRAGPGRARVDRGQHPPRRGRDRARRVRAPARAPSPPRPRPRAAPPRARGGGRAAGAPSAGSTAVRRTALPGAGRRGAVVVLDTVGELAQLYRLADVVFVGGSLVTTGGHNMLEPALWSKARPLRPAHRELPRQRRAPARGRRGVAVQDAGGAGARGGRACSTTRTARARWASAGSRRWPRRQGALRATMDLLERMLAWGDGPRGQAGLR